MRKLCLILLGLFLFAIIISLLITLSSKSPLRDKVAVVRIEGPMFDSKDAIEELNKYVEEPSIKAIVIRVDSPGGAVAPAQEIYEEVKKAVLKKKVVVSMGSVAASGGYYVSAPATKVVANPGTLTGSIGVIMEIPNIEGLMNKIGVKTEVVKSGKYKDMASAFRKLRDNQRKILQGVLDDVHEQFIKAVSEGRKIPIEKVRDMADGRVFTGRQARELGLVDELGNLEDAINLAATLAGIKGKPEVVTKKDKFSLLSLLRGNLKEELRDMIPSLNIKYMLMP
ncbi:MAG: signal peptide peptidase SppA [Nitrospirae bacterium]|nr:signal peptide peptidase SppA [Nitrospirota bacterium]